MKFLVIGNGGREHALVWKLSQSPYVSKIFVAPGNAGTSFIAENIDLKETDIKKLASFAARNELITIVGPEKPLYLGIVDYFEKLGLPILGPTFNASILEYNKIFAKWFMTNHNIPTARFKVACSYSLNEMEKYIEKSEKDLVVKRSGLCGGKGVTVCSSKEEALAKVKEILRTEINVLVEEKIEGKELSFIVLTDGDTVIPLQPCRDYKPIFNGNKGPNTGGMGSYCPVSIPSTLRQKIMDRIVNPTIEGMRCTEKTLYKGFLYFGLMIDEVYKEPYVLEYNVRLGDPETQPLMLKLDTDLAYLIDKSIHNKLHEVKISWKPETAICVSLTSGGYPENYETGKEILGLENTKKGIVFHSGTKLKDNKILTNGGRVLNIATLGNNLNDCRDKVYGLIKKISFEDMHYRKDIGLIESNTPTPALDYLRSLIGDLSCTDVSTEQEAVIRIIESHQHLREKRIREVKAFQNCEVGKRILESWNTKLIPDT